MTAEREQYIKQNIGLAHSCVKRYIGRGIDYDDLFQTACLGLVKAAERFDETRQLKFSTYAVPVILGELKQLFRSEGSIKVSRHTKELGLKIRKTSDRYFSENGHAPRISELAELLCISVSDAAEALCAVQPPDSLDSDELRRRCADDEFEEPVTEFLALRQIIDSLPSSDRVIVIERYMHEHTQSQTAKLLGTTQVQVSRRERKILAFIRSQLEA